MARIILGSLTLGVISFNAFWKFLCLGNSPEEFFGVKFWSREFLGFCLRPKGFLGGYPPSSLGTKAWDGHINTRLTCGK